MKFEDLFYVPRTTINSIIGGMYTYEGDVSCDFEMLYNDKTILTGNSVINTLGERICLNGLMKDINTFNMNDLPLTVELRLFNFTNVCRIKQLEDKNIRIHMNRFRISPDFSLSIEQFGDNSFKIWGEPLVDVKTQTMGDIIIEKVFIWSGKYETKIT